MSLRKWKGFRPQDIKPFQPEQWRTFKDAGILKFMRGKRGGGKTGSNNIPVILSRFRKNFPSLWESQRRKSSVCHRNLLNIQIVSSTHSTSHQPIVDSRERPHFVPSLLLSNPMSLVPKIDEIAFTIKQWDIDVALFTETWLLKLGTRGLVPLLPLDDF